MPAIDLSRFEIPLLIVLGLWGLVSAFQGAGLSLFISGPHQYAATDFIELVYFGVLAGVLVSLISARLASVLLCAAAIAAFIILFLTDGFGHGLATAKSFLWAIALRPVLAAVVLLALPPRGPLLRELAARKARNLRGHSSIG
jgi:hypothetical protein